MTPFFDLLSILLLLLKCYKIVTISLCLANTNKIRRTKLCFLFLIAVPSYLLSFAIILTSVVSFFAPTDCRGIYNL